MDPNDRDQRTQIQSGERQITSCYVVFTACCCRLILLHRYYKRKSSKLLDMLKRIIIQISAIPFCFRKFSFVEVFQILNLSNFYADYHPLKAAVSWRNTFNFPSFINKRNNSNPPPPKKKSGGHGLECIPVKGSKSNSRQFHIKGVWIIPEKDSNHFLW